MSDNQELHRQLDKIIGLLEALQPVQVGFDYHEGNYTIHPECNCGVIWFDTTGKNRTVSVCPVHGGK